MGDTKENAGPLAEAQPVVTKNAFFTYVDGARSPDQIWNIDGLTICVQGSVAGIAERTYFAKKHLLTIYGGKSAARNQDFQNAVWDKGNKIFAKRKPGGGGDKTKYGNTKLYADSACTFIMCDYFAQNPNGLRQTIANCLRGAVKKHQNYAELWFKQMECVVQIFNGDWKFYDYCVVDFKVSEDGDTFLITHLRPNYD